MGKKSDYIPATEIGDVAIRRGGPISMPLYSILVSGYKILADVEPEAQPYLKTDISELIGGLCSLIGGQAANLATPIDRVSVGLKTSQEEDWTEVAVRVHVKADVAQSIAFWDSLGDAIQKWRETLPARHQKLLDEDIAVFVEPTR